MDRTITDIFDMTPEEFERWVKESEVVTDEYDTRTIQNDTESTGTTSKRRRIRKVVRGAKRNNL